MPMTAPSLLPVSAGYDSQPHVLSHAGVECWAIVSHVLRLILRQVAGGLKLSGCVSSIRLERSVSPDYFMIGNMHMQADCHRFCEPRRILSDKSRLWLRQT
jgi:hypothetical protein